MDIFLGVRIKLFRSENYRMNIFSDSCVQYIFRRTGKIVP